MRKTFQPTRRRCAATAACLAAAALACLPAAAGARAPDLQQRLDKLVASGVPGAILVTGDGDRTRRYASGLAQVAPAADARVDRFRIASLTKSYTATVVLQLVAEGRLSLEDSVEQRLPGWCRTAPASRSTSCSTTRPACSTTRATRLCSRRT